MEYFPLIIAFGIIGMIALLFYLAYKADKKRREAIQQAAAMMGFSYAMNAGTVGNFEIYQKNGKVTNQISGKKNGRTWHIFDYEYRE